MGHTIPQSEILLPLYIYPNPGAWDPLFKTIASNPELQFVIIVNPNSGPGSEPWWPNADYVREIPRLNAHSNVRTVGYVSTSYCERPIEKVFEDLDRYAGWAGDERYPGLGLNGIFFDETPNSFTERAKEYLDAITQRVKNLGGALGDRMVIHNPGTTIDEGLAIPGVDITTVAEMDHGRFQTMECQEWLEKSHFGRDSTSYMIYAIPEQDLEDFVAHSARHRAKYIFATDRKTDVYHDFGASWKSFVAAMARCE